MSDTETWSVEDYLTVFHEDDGLLTPVTLNAYATCGPAAEFVQAAMIAMDDDSWIVRARGAKFLGIARTGEQNDSIPGTLWARGESCLITRLQDAEKNVRIEAALALGRVSPTTTNAQAAFPVLHSVAEETDANYHQMRDVALATSEFARALPKEVCRIAPTLLQYSDSEVVCSGLDAIAQCGTLATPILPLICAHARNRDEAIRQRSIDALQSLGQKSPLSLWARISQLFRGSVSICF